MIELHNQVAAELSAAGVELDGPTSTTIAANIGTPSPAEPNAPAESATARRRRTLLGMTSASRRGRGSKGASTASNSSRGGVGDAGTPGMFSSISGDTSNSSGSVHQFVQQHYAKLAPKVANSVSVLACSSEKSELVTALHELMDKTPLACYLIVKEVSSVSK